MKLKSIYQLDLTILTVYRHSRTSLSSYYGMRRGRAHSNLHPEHPIITISKNGIQKGRSIGKKGLLAAGSLDLRFAVSRTSI